MPISSSTFIHIVFLLLGSTLFAFGYMEQLQLVWEAFFLLWFGTFSLLQVFFERWSSNRWYPWLLRILSVLSLSSIIGALYLSTWPAISSMSSSWQYGVLFIWGILLFLCAQFAQESHIRTHVFLVCWFPFLYLLGMIPQIHSYTNGSIWILGCSLLFEGFLRAIWSLYRPIQVLPQTIPYLFFHRVDPLRSFFSALQEKLGIDVQGAQAFMFARRATVPLTAFLFIFLWLLSSFVLILPHETGLRYQFGVPDTNTLNPGVHIKWPWPWGEIQRVPSSRILSMKIGHEEEENGEEEEEESILWANQHAEEEFSLLMGDQVNLIAVDGTLQYQISDARQYLLSWQNPEEQLEGIAYQILSRYCAQRTLRDALSENLQILADDVLKQIQQKAVALELGLMPISFTFSALHPPVSVARDYQSVVSAQIDQQSTIIRAQAYRIKSIPRAKIEAQEERVDAQKEAMERISKAKGEAQAFRGLYETVNSDRELYLFQRRLDVLKKNLKGRRMTIIDHALEKEGATLWIED
ncbi:MAG: hypothetical protein CL916_03860 [Deltaproteobacteria bacterium]|nr:hypothetical protein [Deltaproteobacteria bacterium]